MARYLDRIYCAQAMTHSEMMGSMASNRAAKLVGKVIVCVTEDWFCVSHFKPLLRSLNRIAGEVVVVARSSGRFGELEALGVRAIDLDYNRSSMNPLREARTVRRLAAILRKEQPDVAHLIAMKPIVIGSMATALARTPRTVVHMTGLGFLAISDTAKARIARKTALQLIASTMRRKGSWILVENPEDLTFLISGGVSPEERVTMLGGAGIDPHAFPAMPEAGNSPLVAAFVGRMIRSKGVEVLMAAADLLEKRGIPLTIDLYGETDDGNPDAIPDAALHAWQDGRLRRYLGFTSDVARVWQKSDIFVLPALSREGMPRALLEAASSSRPLIVSDVPGCRHFVRSGVEGLVVPPGNPSELADALARLASEPSLRTRLGAAARAKVLAGFTEAAVEAAIEGTYCSLAATSLPIRPGYDGGRLPK